MSWLLATQPSTSTQLIIAIVTVALGGGVVSILRFRPDRSKVIAEASESAVEAVSGAMEELRRELAEERGKREQFEMEAAAEREAQREIRHELKTRVAELEKKTDISLVLRGLVEIKDEQRSQRAVLENLLTEFLAAIKAADITIHTGGQS